VTTEVIENKKRRRRREREKTRAYREFQKSISMNILGSNLGSLAWTFESKKSEEKKEELVEMR
jgi:hypothetical protein